MQRPPGIGAARLQFLFLVFGLLRAALRDRAGLVADNVLLRRQVAALTRPSRRRLRLGTHDRHFRVTVRVVWRDWRRRLLQARPETVLRWNHQ